MKFALPLLALAGTAFAHNFVTHFHINGVADPGCVRQAVSADPILDINSDQMACNTVQGPAAKKCIVQGGDTVGFEWRVDRNIAPADYPLKDGSIPVGVTDDSHKGPCAVYMKKVSDSSTAEGPGDGWFKVSEDGLDSDGTFCSDRIRLANAPQPGIIPTNIEPGDYLIRAEMITLNNAGPTNMGGLEQPQFYTGCVQLTVEGTSGTNPDPVSIPGYVSMSSPGMIYDIWNSKSGTYSGYTVPGPAPLENLVPFKAGVAPSTIGGAAPSTSATKAASSAPAEYVSSTPAAPTSKAAGATSVYRAPATSAPAVTSTPASDYSESAPVESGDSQPVEEAPTEVPAGAVAVTVTYTTFMTQYTTVYVTATGAEATSTVYATPEAEPTSTRRHRGNGNGNGNGYGRGRAHRRRHQL